LRSPTYPTQQLSKLDSKGLYFVSTSAIYLAKLHNRQNSNSAINYNVHSAIRIAAIDLKWSFNKLSIQISNAKYCYID